MAFLIFSVLVTEVFPTTLSSQITGQSSGVWGIAKL